MYLFFRIRIVYRVCIFFMGILEFKLSMRLIMVRVDFCRCVGKMYLYSDVWLFLIFIIVLLRKGKVKVYLVVKIIILMGFFFGVLLNMTEFFFIFFTFGLMIIFLVMIRFGSLLFSIGFFSRVLNKIIDREENC